MLLILGLALVAAFNPKLLIIDLILAGNKNPRLMFLCFLLGGIAVGLTVGLLDLFLLHTGATKTQNHVSGGIDLALGIPLLAAGALLATNHVHVHRRRHHPPPTDKPKDKQPSKLSVWAQQALHEPRYALAVLIGAAVGTPGASYLLALHHLKTGKYPIAVAVLAVIVFVLITFVLVIVPFAFWTFRPEGTEKAIQGFKDWLASHARQVAAGVALVAGGFMVISGLLRVLS
jgi:Sap, sulfolipid-1-addressing protein